MRVQSLGAALAMALTMKLNSLAMALVIKAKSLALEFQDQ